MMRIATLLLALSTAIAVAGQTAVNIARQYAGSVVTILTEDAYHQSLALGSGFLVGNGKVVTNYHVVEGAKYATVVTASGGKYPIDGAFAHSALHDLAVLSAPGLNGSVILSSDSTQVGERIYAIGSPEGLSNSLSEGIVSGKRTMNGARLIQITAAISPGSSGGPVINERGSVIGVAVGAISSGQNLNFAIPVAMIHPLLTGSTVSPLSALLARKVGPSSGTSSITSEAVSVSELDFSAPYWVVSPSGADVVGGHELKGISLINNTAAVVRKVKLIFILYNAKGVPLDHLSMVLCDSRPERVVPNDYDKCEDIPSGLSKYYDFQLVGFGKRVFDRRRGEKLIVRILDVEFTRE